MGLDIHIGVNNHAKVFTQEYNSFKLQHSLSRTFCNFICRKCVIPNTEIPELDQIGEFTKTDITPIYKMENYPSDEYINSELNHEKDESERERLNEKFTNLKSALEGNIDLVFYTINSLVEKLSKMDNLLELLEDNDYDTFDLGRERYFSDFNLDKGDGYIRNNLGQDLRNFKRFLEYVKERGATTVYFEYG